MLSGRVATFEVERGWGTIVADDGDEVAFHATAIADGSRRIDVGASVIYRRVAGTQGRWEAAAVTPTVAGDATDQSPN